MDLLIWLFILWVKVGLLILAIVAGGYLLFFGGALLLGGVGYAIGKPAIAAADLHKKYMPKRIQEMFKKHEGLASLYQVSLMLVLGGVLYLVADIFNL